MSLFFLIWFFIISAAVYVFATRGLFPRLRRGHRPMTVRWVCALLALFILASMLHGLRAQTRQTYADAPPGELRVPVQPVELTAEALAAGEFDMLVHLVAGTLQDQTFFPFEIREIRLPWPEGQGESLAVEMRPAGREVQVILRPGEMQDWTRQRNQPGHYMKVSYEHEISQRGSGAGSRIVRLPSVFQVFHRNRVPLPRHPYSLVPGLEADLAAVGVITPIAAYDPGRPVSVEDFINEHAGEIHATLSRTHSSHRHARAHGLFALIGWTGPQFFLLVVAAILGAQCFRRRGLGFTLCMILLMICLVGMDKYHQSQHQSRAENETLTASEREIARQISEVSFFFR